jgi:glycosyltransferase involved in cell wall biosynthesis
MLLRLVATSDRARFEHRVVSLTDIGAVGERIAALGVAVEALGMRRGPGDVAAVVRLVRLLGRHAPDLVQTWMYHADLVGGLAARLGARAPVLWNLRQSTLEPGSSRRATLLARGLCARLSRLVPERIVCCARAAKELHVGLGYPAKRMVVIPNGVDTEAFRPDAGARRELRAELGIHDGAPLIGAIGRWDPQKDYPTFVAAAARLADREPEARFLLCGEGLEGGNAALTRLIDEAGLGPRFDLLGRRDDVARITAALDIACSSSAYGEGFSNAIAEAMACAVPCAVTEVGDSAYLVGASGRVVAPRAPEALARAWSELIGLGAEGRAALGAKARARIARHFTLPAVVARYQSLYVECARARGRRRGG